MSELDCRILARACGLAWITDARKIDDQRGIYNPTFTTPDDWELVRQKVVVPNRDGFGMFLWLQRSWSLRSWITFNPEEKNQYAADFIKSSPDLFPWAVEMLEGKK